MKSMMSHIFVIAILITLSSSYAPEPDQPEGGPRISAENCRDPPHKAGQPKLYKHCAVASFEDWRSEDGFCFYSTEESHRPDFLYIGERTCKRIDYRKCEWDTDCCKGLSCESADLYKKYVHGYVNMCRGRYDVKYANGLKYHKTLMRPLFQND
ncbi:hypothetical protein Fcan01_16183 [Folsomia candida]|uniref:Uncharacterized protein n=1 Tax=Folsomia candida TaxID=158441 RepID=A0A226DVQ1_FOLCA|nr:hypothetical protein Fcan01_16183 [Folsomia candida]